MKAPDMLKTKAKSYSLYFVRKNFRRQLEVGEKRKLNLSKTD